jgi:hypothetical protein
MTEVDGEERKWRKGGRREVLSRNQRVIRPAWAGALAALESSTK